MSCLFLLKPGQRGPRLDSILEKQKQEHVELMICYVGKIHKGATRKVFGSQVNHETCYVAFSMPRVRLTAAERKDSVLSVLR